MLENREIIEEFNRTVFESIVDKVVVGRIDKDGTVHPYDLTFYFKTGVKDSQDSNNFKDKRKNAKDNDSEKLCSYKNDEDKKLCSQSKDNACGVRSVATTKQRVKILYFKHFFKHFVFIEKSDFNIKKVLKNILT